MPTDLTGKQWTAINGAIVISGFIGMMGVNAYLVGRWTAGTESRIDAVDARLGQFEDSRNDARGNNERRFANIERQLETAGAAVAATANQIGLLTQTVANSIGESGRRQTEAERRIVDLEADRIPTVTKMSEFSGKIDRLGDALQRVERALDAGPVGPRSDTDQERATGRKLTGR